MFLEWLSALLQDVWLLALHLSGRHSFPKPLSAAEEAEAVRLLSQGDAAAREKLVVHNLRLVAHIAKKYASSGEDSDDLVSIGSIGLMKAVNTFRPEAGRLTSYASRCIENEILMVLRRTSRLKLEVSFDEPLNTDVDGNELLLSDIMGTEPDLVSRDLDSSIERASLRTAIRGLSSRERNIVELRYGIGGGNERTQKEVADILGISQSYISRLEKRIMTKLRTELEKMA